jgi:carbonic anhydrase
MGSIPEVRTTNAGTPPPTASPTRDLFANHIPPSQPEPWYFNYDTSSRYGPGELALYRIPLPTTPNTTTSLSGSTILQVGVREDPWGQVQSPPREQNYWTEFTDAGFGPYQGVLQIHDPTERNMCAVGQQQSPIDVRPTNGVDSICREEHQVRTLPGDYPIQHHHVEKRIESNKLRLVYPRRPCADLTKVECQEPDPPQADFPNGWGGFADVLHVDFKVPSEHVLEGERFDAEMQIFHVHAGRRRLAAHSVLIRARDNGYNYYFQEALDAFLEEYDRNRELCMQREKAKSNLHRSLTSLPRSGPFGDFLSWARSMLGHRSANKTNTHEKSGVWDPHHPMLVPSLYFYRYEGSLTEPPCGEFVSWWITDQPMIIGLQQLEQLQAILFSNVEDQSCEKSGVQYDRSVARPIRQVSNRDVYKCTARNFGPDP